MTQTMSAFLSRTEVWVFALATAAFLALYWAFRGAPIGQAADDEGADAPRASYRDRVIGAVVVGLLLILGGAYIALARSLLWSIPVFAAGFGLVLTLIAFNQRYRHASPALRRTIDLSNTALTIALVVGILIVINVLAFRYGGRAIDLTRERTFSLESLTNNQLKALDRPVTFTLSRARVRWPRFRRIGFSKSSTCTRRPIPTGSAWRRSTPTSSRRSMRRSPNESRTSP